MESPRAEVLTYQQVVRRAHKFSLIWNPDCEVPVNIDHIVEHTGLDIVPTTRV